MKQRSDRALTLRRARWLTLFSLCTFALASSESKESKAFSLEVTRAWADNPNAVYVEGKTNLPNDDELQLTISTEPEGNIAVSSTQARGGRFRCGPIDPYRPLTPGRYIVEVTAVDQGGSEPIYSKIISISDSRDTASRINAASTKTVDQLTKERTDAANEIEDRIRPLIKELLGDRLKEVDASGVVAPGVKVSFIAGEDGKIGVDLTQKEMEEVYHRIFTSNVDVSDVTLRAYAAPIDALGNQKVQIVYATHMSKDRARMINWENKNHLDFTKLWDTQIEDPRWMRKE
jgi:hypothetical protein